MPSQPVSPQHDNSVAYYLQSVQPSGEAIQLKDSEPQKPSDRDEEIGVRLLNWCFAIDEQCHIVLTEAVQSPLNHPKTMLL